MNITTAPRVLFKRRKQVKTACINCRRSKTACDEQRPCRRCVGLGINSSCKDAPRKKPAKPFTEQMYLEAFTKNVETQYTVALDESYREIMGNERKETKSCDNYSLDAPVNISITQQIVNRNHATIQDNQSYAQQPEKKLKNISDGQTEKELLYAHIAKLEQENLQKNSIIDSLNGMLQSQKIFSTMALTRWKIICPGVCRLLSYSSGFVELTNHRPDVLQSCFTCVQMYPAEEFSKTQYFFDLICSGRVESFTARVPIVCGSGNVVDVFSMIKIEFENDVPVAVCCCTKQFDQGTSGYEDVPYFRPFLVKLYKPVHQNSSPLNLQSSSPPLSSSFNQQTNQIQQNSDSFVPQTPSPPYCSSELQQNTRHSPPYEQQYTVRQASPTETLQHSPPRNQQQNSTMQTMMHIFEEQRQQPVATNHHGHAGNNFRATIAKDFVCKAPQMQGCQAFVLPNESKSNFFSDKDFGIPSSVDLFSFHSTRPSSLFNDNHFSMGTTTDFTKGKPLLQFEL